MFPPHGAEIYYNEAGEPLGWSMPAEPDYCDIHGVSFISECRHCRFEEDTVDLDDEEDARFDDHYDDEYDPGNEVDDEGGMSEFRHQLASSGYDAYE